MSASATAWVVPCVAGRSGSGVFGKVFRHRLGVLFRMKLNIRCGPPSSPPLPWSLLSSSSGIRLMPRGGWIVLCRCRLPGVPDLVDIVRLLLIPSHSYCSPSATGSRSRIRSSCSRRASSASIFCLETDILRMIAAVPRMASAFGSVSGCSCSATVRTWSRSPVKTAVSGTSLADLESCSNITPAHI